MKIYSFVNINKSIVNPFFIKNIYFYNLQKSQLAASRKIVYCYTEHLKQTYPVESIGLNVVWKDVKYYHDYIQQKNRALEINNTLNENVSFHNVKLLYMFNFSPEEIHYLDETGITTEL